jgi:alpha-L-fucosidase
VVSDGASLTAELGKSVAPFEQELRLSDIPDLDIDEEYLYTYDRQFFEGELSFAEGEQMVSIFVDGLQPDEVVDFRALELIPVAALADLEAEETQAEEQRADTNWMVDAKYGVMFHWTDMTVNEDGSQIDYKTAVDGFDVEAFGALSEEVGAGYVIFTVNHQYPHCPAPIAAWEAIHPGWTTQRDLIGEIADELNGRDIQLVLYVASHLVGNPDGGREVRWLRAHEYGSSVEIPEASHFDIFENNKAVLTAIGERYGERVAGFWLDGWDLIPEVYPHSDFRALFDASKTGNPDRVVAFNRWVFPTVTPWQDYWAGEIDSPDKSPTEQIMTTEVGKGLQYQALIAMEDDWLYSQEGLSWGSNTYKLRYSVNELVGYINDVHAVRGAVTINLAIRQDGTIQPKALERMIAVKAAVH